MYTLNYKHHFDASHKLNNYDGKCANLHGHRWEVEVMIQSSELTKDMVIDFTVLKSIIDKLDHICINEVVDFNPTAENIAMYLKTEIGREASEVNPSISYVSVKVNESPNASITC